MAAEEASFSTLIDSTSYGFTSSILPSTPSMSINGDEAPLIDAIPRTLIEPDLPGIPLLMLTFTFGAAP